MKQKYRRPIEQARGLRFVGGDFEPVLYLFAGRCFMKTLLKVSLIAAAFLLLPVSSSFAHGDYGYYSSGYCPSFNFGFSYGYGYPPYYSYNPYYSYPYSYNAPYYGYNNYYQPYYGYNYYRPYYGQRYYGYRNHYRNDYYGGYYGGRHRSYRSYPRVQKPRYSTPRQGSPVVRRR